MRSKHEGSGAFEFSSESRYGAILLKAPKRLMVVPTGRGQVQAEAEGARHLQHGGELGRASAGQLASQLATGHATSLWESANALCVRDGRQRAVDDLRVAVAFNDAGLQQRGNGSRMAEARSEFEQFEGGLVRGVICGIWRAGVDGVESAWALSSTGDLAAWKATCAGAQGGGR